MLFVDNRAGSKELIKPLRELGLTVEPTTLEFGDLAFQGKGSELIGVEFKTLGDFVSSVRSGRLVGHQLPGMTASYQYVWLVVEGLWRVDAIGQVTTYAGKRGWRVLPGKITGSELQKRLLTLEVVGGVHVRLTNARTDTVQYLSHLYRWWTDRALTEHTSVVAVHKPLGFLPVSDFRAVVSQFPHVGLRTSAAVEQTFKTLRRAVTASVDEWAKVTTEARNGRTKRLGLKAAQDIVDFCQGRK